MKALMHNVDRGSGGAVFSSWRRLAFPEKASRVRRSYSQYVDPFLG
jgi:hypothetical protein